MTTPAAIAVYQASTDAQATAALTILVLLLRTLAQKGSLSPDDVETIIERAQKVHDTSPIIRRKAAATVIANLGKLIE